MLPWQGSFDSMPVTVKSNDRVHLPHSELLTSFLSARYTSIIEDLVFPSTALCLSQWYPHLHPLCLIKLDASELVSIPLCPLPSPHVHQFPSPTDITSKILLHHLIHYLLSLCSCLSSFSYSFLSAVIFLNQKSISQPYFRKLLWSILPIGWRPSL